VRNRVRNARFGPPGARFLAETAVLSTRWVSPKSPENPRAAAFPGAQVRAQSCRSRCRTGNDRVTWLPVLGYFGEFFPVFSTVVSGRTNELTAAIARRKHCVCPICHFAPRLQKEDHNSRNCRAGSWSVPVEGSSVRTTGEAPPWGGTGAAFASAAAPK
jgi:hypothetical protein